MNIRGWFLGMAAVLAASWAFLAASFHLVPDPMPVHFGADGQPDGWEPKSLPGALALTGLPTFMLAFSGVASVGIIQLTAREAGERQRLLGRTVAAALARLFFWLTVILTVGITVSLLGHHGPLLPVLLIGGGALSLVGFAVQLSRGYRTVGATHPPGEKERHMRFGFYWNADDPDTVVSLENGMTTTLNFARPAAWGILALLLAPPTLAVILAIVAG